MVTAAAIRCSTQGRLGKVHYSCTNTGTAGCFNCCGAHAYPAFTALFTGGDTFTANAGRRHRCLQGQH